MAIRRTKRARSFSGASWASAANGGRRSSSLRLLPRVGSRHGTGRRSTGSRSRRTRPSCRRCRRGGVWATVDQAAQAIGGLTKNPARGEIATRYPYLRVANVYADRLKLDDVKTIGVAESELKRVLLRAGDLLVVEGNGSADQIGRVAEWRGELTTCCHQNHLIKVRCDHDRACLPRWLLLWLLSPLGRRRVLDKASSTSGLYTLSLSKVRALPFPLAPSMAASSPRTRTTSPRASSWTASAPRAKGKSRGPAAPVFATGGWPKPPATRGARLPAL